MKSNLIGWIRHLYLEGHTNKEISVITGELPSYISKIVRRKLYRDVDPIAEAPSQLMQENLDAVNYIMSFKYLLEYTTPDELQSFFSLLKTLAVPYYLIREYMGDYQQDKLYNYYLYSGDTYKQFNSEMIDMPKAEYDRLLTGIFEPGIEQKIERKTGLVL